MWLFSREHSSPGSDISSVASTSSTEQSSSNDNDSDRSDWKSKFEQIKVTKTRAENGIRSLGNDINELNQILSAAENEVHNNHIRLEKQLSQIEDLSINLKYREDELSKYDERVIELESQNLDIKQRFEMERQKSISEITTIINEKTQLEARLKEVAEELKKERQTHETNTEQMQNEITQLHVRNKRVAEEFQGQLALSENRYSKLDEDRAIFEEQIKHLSEELERTKKSLEEVTAENEKNVRYILLVIILPLAMDDKDVDIHMLQMLKDNFD